MSPEEIRIRSALTSLKDAKAIVGGKQTAYVGKNPVKISDAIKRAKNKLIELGFEKPKPKKQKRI